MDHPDDPDSIRDHVRQGPCDRPSAVVHRSGRPGLDAPAHVPFGGPLRLPEGRDLSRPFRIQRTDPLVRELDRIGRVEAEEPGGFRMELGGPCLEQRERKFLRQVDDREALREDRSEPAGRADVRRVEGNEPRRARPPRPLEGEDASRRFSVREDLVVRLLEHAVPRHRISDGIGVQEVADAVEVFDSVGGRGPSMPTRRKRLTAGGRNGFRPRSRGRPSPDPSPRRWLARRSPHRPRRRLHPMRGLPGPRPLGPG